MALYKHNPNPNAFVRFMRKIYNRLGFHKGYNFALFFIFGGALLGFCLARLSYLDVNGTFLENCGPGEAYWYRQDYYNIGIHIHLICVIPAGLLAIFQFVPVIRYKALQFHRLNGYLVLLLILVGNVGALMIVRRAFGGTMTTQSAVGVLAIATTTSAVLSYINIKRLQIEQHRAWMLRLWAYLGAVVTSRLIMILSVMIVSRIGSYYFAISCQQIAGSGGDMDKYAACREDPNGYTAVHAAFDNANGIEEVAATFQLTFGMAVWLSIVLHAVGIELYLHLTSAEAERLRQVSYERQLERGMKSPGSAGLTSDRLGDVEAWKPAIKHDISSADLSDKDSTTSKPEAVVVPGLK